ncbi:hypothetical protein JJV70_15205 [Streptomyces sp. JJ66]|uniref:hypothetical protein n=1 Tax=Streptomyces sp. JJ66 TaxID=2803843 RepID=UPI001C5627F2|nr:hypothetical protein [Streptomyces sp. JJ66]MBW1603427.1 hypothetical protein [Streptomyces sp. JJ66]
MDHLAEPAPRLCAACHRTVHPTTPGGLCDRCYSSTATHLAKLPGLYAALGGVLAPGRGAALVGTRHSGSGGRAPLRLHAIDLQTEAHAVLTSWAREWVESGYATAPDWPASAEGQVAEACRVLRWNWGRASRQHPAVAEFVDEIAQWHRRIQAAVTGDPGERRIGVVCACGTVLRVTVSTGRASCGGCGTEYPRVDLLGLPLASRSATANAA